jgi:membrane protein DedA with SNARE-associated domain
VANVTAAPVVVTATPTPAAVNGNVTERVGGDTNSLAIVAIVILALLIVGLVAWDRWRTKK